MVKVNYVKMHIVKLRLEFGNVGSASFSDLVNSVIQIMIDDKVFRLGLWMNLSLDRYSFFTNTMKICNMMQSHRPIFVLIILGCFLDCGDGVSQEKINELVKDLNAEWGYFQAKIQNGDDVK
jgi:hypothetical protein